MTGANGAPGRVAVRRYTLVLFAVALIVVAGFLTSLLTATDGHVVPQVVDLYLVCQYAKAMAEGHPFHYNAGDPASTGATSLLHTAVLAAAHAAGIRGEGLVAFAIALGAALFVASVFVAHRAGVRLAGEPVGLLAGLLVALGGPVVWAFLSGSDVAMFLFLALWLFERVVAAWESPTPAAWVVPATLLALARPEGLPLGALLAAAWLWDSGRRATRAGRALAGLPILAGLAVMGLYKAITGSWLGTSVADKSLFASYGLAQGLALATEYGVDVLRGLLLGLYPSQVPIGLSRGWAPYYLPPLTLAFVIVGLVCAPRPLSRPIAVWLMASAVIMALVTPSTFLGFHFQRYILWAIPPLAVLAASGLSRAVDLFDRARPGAGRWAFAASAVFWVLLGCLATARFAVMYGDMGADVWRRDVAAAHFIERHLERGVAIANLGTSVEYLTGHRSVNLHGVTAPAFFGNRAAEREANVFETLGRIPPAERPPYLITSVSAMDLYPSMQELIVAPPLFRTSSFADELEIYAMRYDVLGASARPYAAQTLEEVRGLTEVDHLNVGDARDEADHAYRFVSTAGTAHLYGTVRADRYGEGGPRVVDGGRAILGRETFAVKTRPGRDLLVVLRTSPAIEASVLRASGPVRVGLEFAEAGLIVAVDGTVSGRLSFRTSPGWNEVVLRITGNLVRSERTAIEVAGRYASFHYWFYQ